MEFMLKKIILCTTVFGLNFIVAGNELPQEERDLYPQELQDVNEANLDAARSRLLSKIQKRNKIAGLEKIQADIQRLMMRKHIAYRQHNTLYNPTENRIVNEYHEDKEFFIEEYLALISDLADVNFELYEMNDVLGNFIYANTDIDYEYCLMMAVKLLRTHFFTNLASEHGCTELFNECSVFIEDLINTEIDNTSTANKVQEALEIYNDSLIGTKYSALYLKKLVILCKKYYMLRNGSSASDIVLKETFEDVIARLKDYLASMHYKISDEFGSDLGNINFELLGMNDVLGSFIYEGASIDYKYCLMMTVKLLRTYYFRDLESDISNLISTEIGYASADSKVVEALGIYYDLSRRTKYPALYLEKLLILCKKYHMLRNESSASNIILNGTFEDVMSKLENYLAYMNCKMADKFESDFDGIKFERSRIDDVLESSVYAGTKVDYECCLLMTVPLLRTHYFRDLESNIKNLIDTELGYTSTANKVQEALGIYNDSLIGTKYSILYLKKLLILWKKYYMLRNKSSASEVILNETFEAISILDRDLASMRDKTSNDTFKDAMSELEHHLSTLPDSDIRKVRTFRDTLSKLRKDRME